MKLKTVDIKGKEYVEVNTRIQYFREHYPTGSIITEPVNAVWETDIAVFKASIVVDGTVRATGFAYEKAGSTFINKTSHIENAETSAIGRALGIFGIGIDGSVASAEEVANAIKQQEGYKTASKATKEETEEYWFEYVDICQARGVTGIELLKWLSVEMGDKNMIHNAVVKLLRDKELFQEQLTNYLNKEE